VKSVNADVGGTNEGALLQQFQEGGENPFGHPPEHSCLEVVTGALDDGPVATVLHRAVGPGSEEGVERYPPGAGYFGVGTQWNGCRQREHEWPHQDRWEDRGPRGKIIQHADQRRPGQIDRDLLEGLPSRGRDEIGIAGTPATARKGELPRPAIVLTLGTANEEDAIGFRREDDRNGGMRAVGLVFGAGSAEGQSGGEFRDPAQCE
jgi:hypothetical protein